MAEHDYRSVPDGGVLKTLASGLQIIRRKKHEWLAYLQHATPAELKRLTDKIRGSKFVASWTLNRYVEWIETQVTELGWDAQTSAEIHTVAFDQTIGYSRGKPVDRIRIELSSRCLHAYPVEE